MNEWLDHCTLKARTEKTRIEQNLMLANIDKFHQN